MKTSILYWFLVSLTLSLHAQFTDNFDPPMLSPSWKGDTTHFDLKDGSLMLNAPEAGSSFLIRKIPTFDSATWIIQFSLDFPPSGSNYLKTFLMTDTVPVKNGYMLTIGESGSGDAVEMHRVNQSNASLMIRGQDGFFNQGSDSATLKITRSGNGKWALYAKASENKNWQKQGEAHDTSLVKGKYTGMKCHYTSSRTDKFSFHSFSVSGTPYIDSVNPRLLSARILPPRRIKLEFSEELAALTGKNFSSKNLPPLEIQGHYRTACTLKAPALLQPDTLYTIKLYGIQDKAGNQMPDTTLLLSFQKATPYDIVINEILPDPTPPIALPQHEFIELHNRSNKSLNLAKWSIKDPSGVNELPNYTLPPEKHLILCRPEAAKLYNNYGSVLEVPSLIRLNNGQDTLVLQDSTGQVIHALAYNKDNYGNFSSNGRSLVPSNTSHPCQENNNWMPSVANRGGTPGTSNLRLEKSSTKEESLALLHTYPKDSLSFILYFNQTLQQNQDINIRLNGYKNIRTRLLPPFFNQLQITLPAPLQKKSPQLIIDSLYTCSGKLNTNLSARLALPEKAGKQDLIINELLFDPVSESVDFIELYNTSSKVIDLKTIKLGKTTGEGLIQKAVTVAPGGLLVFPHDYVVISRNINTLKQYHSIPEQAILINTSSMPNYPNTAGGAALLNNNGDLLETFLYNEDMHSNLLSNTEGVSLERLEPEVSSKDVNNWHSAASAAGFATPGKRNSNYLYPVTSKGFAIPNKAFSPDGNGFRDFLRINYQFPSPGTMLNLYVFDRHGNKLRHLYNNHSLGTKGNLRWNGLLNNGKLAPPGIYLLFFEYFSADGNSEQLKKHCVLIH